MNIEFKKNKPFIEGVNINNIIESYKTPLYIYSQKKILETYNKLKDNLSANIFYAVKANSNQAILTLIKNCGAGADVVSYGELRRSLKAGFKANKIIYEGVGKSKEDIEYAIKKNIRMINVESINELILINQLGKNLNKKVNIGLRLNPNIDSKTLDKISTGKKTDKFGISLKDLKTIISKFNSYSNINLKGISCHVGSQIKDINIFKKVFKKMHELAKICISSGVHIDHVDLGGGFGINYNGKKNELDIKKLGKLVSTTFKNVPYDISFEPGRYLLAKSGIIITKILSTKQNGGINFLITDAGMQTLIRPSMYGANHKIDALDVSSNKKIKYTVAGPICESADILAKKILLPEQKINNYLIIYDVGAYGATMASNYNSRGIPTELLINKKKFAVIHKESIVDIIDRDSIPSWLRIN